MRNVGARRGLIDSRKQSASFSYPDGESKFDLYRIVEAQDGFAVRIDGKPVGGRDIRIESKPLAAFRLRSQAGTARSGQAPPTLDQAGDIFDCFGERIVDRGGVALIGCLQRDCNHRAGFHVDSMLGLVR